MIVRYVLDSIFYIFNVDGVPLATVLRVNRSCCVIRRVSTTRLVLPSSCTLDVFDTRIGYGFYLWFI